MDRPLRQTIEYVSTVAADNGVQEWRDGVLPCSIPDESFAVVLSPETQILVQSPPIPLRVVMQHPCGMIVTEEHVDKIFRGGPESCHHLPPGGHVLEPSEHFERPVDQVAVIFVQLGAPDVPLQHLQPSNHDQQQLGVRG
jgi:hypothetical protein